MTDKSQAVDSPKQETGPKTLLEYVTEAHALVIRAKGDGVRPEQLLLGVMGRMGLNAWDFFLSTFDPGPPKAAGK